MHGEDGRLTTWLRVPNDVIANINPSGGWWTGALPHNERRVDEQPVFGDVGSIGHESIEQFDSDFTECGEVLAHSGQGRKEERRLRRVVETHHAHVLGDPHASLVQGMEKSEGHLVVGDEDGGHGAIIRKPQTRVVSRLCCPVSVKYRWRRHTMFAQLGPPAVRPQPTFNPIGGAGNVVHGPVAELEKVARC